jgi:Ribbon-helix-helix domain
MPDDTTRWTVSVSKETDITVRSFLAQRGMKKGDLSKFIEDAVRWRIFNRTVQEIKSRNASADPDELQAIIDGAVREARTERRTKRKANKA